MKTKTIFLASRTVALVLASILLLACAADRAEIRVMTSGGFAAPYNELVPEYERTTGNKIVTAYGASMGNAPDAARALIEFLSSPAAVPAITKNGLEPATSQ